MTPRLRLAIQRAVGVLLGVAAIGVGAQCSVHLPGASAPQSLQSGMVLLVGAALGARHGMLAVAWYLALGAAGLPLFANGASGPAHFTGATAGFLVGFLPAAALMGWHVARHGGRALAATLLAGLAAHGCILGLGWARLAWTLGSADAYTRGVAPFLAGAVAKSLLAAALIAAASYGLSRRQRPTPGP